MLKIRTLLVICFALLCLGAAPAMADLFGFSFSNIRSTFDGSNTFQSMDWSNTTGTLYRNIAPTGTASFDSGSWGMGLEDLLVQMTISNITANTADGIGTITLKDIQGDTLAANVGGAWQNLAGFPVFAGTLGTVTYAPATNTFDGHSGDSVSLVFAQPQPWNGAIVELNTRGSWFTPGASTDVRGGSIDASVVPVPAALLLGMLGLSVAGLKLRRFA
jgi:hypothetical protein